MATTKDELTKRLAKIHGHSVETRTMREALVARARKQLDSITPVIEQIEEHVEADRAGGILGHRRLKTLLHERKRLERLIARQEEHLHDTDTT